MSDGVGLAAQVVLVPVLSMIVCSIGASNIHVSPSVEACFQNFAAGLVFFAIAGELFPLLSFHPETGEPIKYKNQVLGISLGFFFALVVIYALEYFMSSFEEELESEGHVLNTIDGPDSKNNDRNKEFYKKVAEAQGMELDENNRIKIDRSQSEDSGSGASSPKKSSGKSSPGKIADVDAIELGNVSDGDDSYVKVKADGDDAGVVAEGEGATDEGFVGFVGSAVPDDYEETAVVEASKAFSDPNHRSHILEHIQELVEAVKSLEEKSIKITDGVASTSNAGVTKIETLSLKDADQVAEEMDMGIHKLEYLLDHCRRLIQGTEFEFHYDDSNVAPTTFNRINEAKRALMKRRIGVLRLTAEHLLEHVQEGETITPSLLKEIHMHMNEMGKHLEYFHDSVESASNRWTKLHKLPDTATGDFLPVALIVPVIMDCFIDGLLIGVTCSLKKEAGIVLALANFVEMGFLGIAYATRITKCTGSTALARTCAIYGPPCVMYLTALFGSAIAIETRNTESVFVAFVSFGVVSYLYLTNELVIEAKEAQGDDQKWYINMWIFIGVWLPLITEPLME